MRARAWLGSLGVLLLWLAATGLTWPRDDGGTPAPPCSFIDDSITPNLLVFCSKSNPLPAAPGVSAATDPFGFGRVWFFGTYAPANPVWGLFLDATNVVTVRGPGGSNIAVDRSADGGKTFPVSFTAPLPANRFFNNTLTFSPTGAFFLAIGSDNVVAPRILRSTSLTSWTSSAALSDATGTFSALGVQGATAVVWGQTAGNVGEFCRSPDSGATWGTCVTIAGSNGPQVNGGGTYTITSPALSTWLLIDASGKLFRSTDDAATFTLIQTLPAGSGTGGTAVLCVSATRCVGTNSGGFSFSDDGGLTWSSAVASYNLNFDSFCNFGNGILFSFNQSLAPSATGAYFGGVSSLTNGKSWFPVNVNGGFTVGLPKTDSLTCASGGKGFITARASGTIGSFFNPTVAGGGLIIGSTGNALAIDVAGRLTANQGLAATGPLPWFQVPVQGPTLLNAAPVVSAANAAATVTLTGVAGTRVCLRTLAVKATGAAATFTLTISDGATVVLDLGTQTAALNGAADVFTGSPLVCANTANNLLVNIGAGGVGAITTTSAIADRN
jgi:hypothetical protein